MQVEFLPNRTRRLNKKASILCINENDNLENIYYNFFFH